MAKKIKGTLQVSNDVIAELAGYAAMSCYGVVGMSAWHKTNSLEALLSIGQVRQGVEVITEQDDVQLTLHVIIDSGVNMRSVSENLKSSVEFMLNTLAEIDNPTINVVIEGVKTR